MKKSADQQRPGGRPKDIPDYNLIVLAAQLHYTYGLTRGAIAERLGVQTRKVTELLGAAVQHRIVKITVDRDLNAEQKLERGLQEKYPHLQRALIVQARILETEKPEDLPKRLGRAAAGYLDELYAARSGKSLHVAVTGGETLLDMASALPEMQRANLYVHAAALIGHARLPEKHSHPHPGAVASILWARSGMMGGRYMFWCAMRSEEHTSELQSLRHLVCRLLL